MIKSISPVASGLKKTALASAFVAVLAIAGAPAAQAADDGSLTWNGITLYGTLDVGVAYQNHGAPLSDDFYVGLDYLVSKNGRKSISAVAPSGLSQSKVGLKGTEPLTDDLSAVFNAEIGFNPTSGKLSDALQSLVNANGKPLTAQDTAGDGSRAGQVFNGPAFLGLSSKTFGTLTAGRHNSLMLDDVNKYDPMGGSYAFSVIGYSGATAGMGNTENARFDDSVKYNYTYQWLRVGALYQFGHNGDSGKGGSAEQIDFGFDYAGFSGDFLYGSKNGAIGAGSLSAAQLATGVPHDSLVATVSDTTAYSGLLSYTAGPLKFSGGYEHIEFENPEHPLSAGFSGLGSYDFSIVNNTAYNRHRILQVSWGGAKWTITKELSLTGAVYHYDQNSYRSSGGTNGAPIVANNCSTNVAGSCSGDLWAYSLMTDYRFTKRFDVYAGAMYSEVQDGLASGYLHPNNLNVMVGARFAF
ncbi:MAG: porin [Dokdonella sp.]